MRPISKKRQTAERHYNRLRREVLTAHSESGEGCFFCSQAIWGEADIHHLRGRENDLLTDVDNLVVVHRKCHSDWHDKPLTHHYPQPWFEGFMARLSKKDKELHTSLNLKLDVLLPRR